MSNTRIGNINIYLKSEFKDLSKDTVGYTFIDKVHSEFNKECNTDLKKRLLENMNDLTDILENLVSRLDLDSK